MITEERINVLIEHCNLEIQKRLFRLQNDMTDIPILKKYFDL